MGRLRWLSVLLSLWGWMPLLGLSADYRFDPYSPEADVEKTLAPLADRVASPESVSRTLLTPMMTGEGLSSMDGSKPFAIKKRCPSSPDFLQLLALPGATGDISELLIKQDKDMDGSFDSIERISTPISGVCANGLMSCRPGTWTGCRSFIWTTTHDGTLDVLETALEKLGGCYCINNSCGESLMLKNAAEVLGHLGGGAVAALSAATPTLALSGVRVDETAITYSGQLSDRCGLEGTSGHASYASEPHKLASAAKTTALRSDLFAKVTKGVAAADTDMTHHTCSITRTVAMDEASAEDIVLFDGGAGAVSRCGTGCLQMVLGTIGDDYWTGTCGLYEESAKFWVEKPERILSATLERAKFDDHIQVIADGRLLWAHDAAWTDIAASSYPPSTIWAGGTVPYCERKTSWDVAPAVDFTSVLKSPGPHSFRIRVAVSDRGEGYAFARVTVDESCRLKPDVITNSCEVYAKEPSCTLEREVTDGITTYRDFRPTGLAALPSTRTLTGKVCSDSATRSWWEKERVYRCKKSSSYDLTGVARRSATIKDSVSETGYEDLTLDSETGVMTSISALDLKLPELPDMATCEQTCKTTHEVEADAVAGMGPAMALRTSSDTHTVTYKVCDTEGRCPLEAGEREILPCGCHSFFSEAAVRMQSGRLGGRDLTCTSGVPSPL